MEPQAALTIGQNALFLLLAVAAPVLLTVLGGAQSFFTWTDDIALSYQLLAVVALVLLVVPLASLGGAAARLSARRRDDRLATLRLLGATPATVSALAVMESTVLALAGSLAGVVGYFAIVPALALVPFRGEPLGIDGVVLGVPVIAGTVLGIATLAAVSAVLGLRQVVISPLGVRTRQDAPKLSWVRAGVAALGGQGGGGRPDMAQGGGPDGAKAAEAIASVRAAIASVTA